MTTKPRGSDLLAAKWTEADLTQLIEMQHEGVSLVKFFPKGIPPVIDGGSGTWQVQPAAIGSFVEQLVKLKKGPGGIWIFPNGIPVVTTFEVGFKAGSANEP
jgi:hypothetical protein